MEVKKMKQNERIEELEFEISCLKRNMKSFDKLLVRERVRVDRVVQVLLNNLPKENLNKKVNFSGIDCCGSHRSWSGCWDGKTLRDFLNEIIDP